jgi:cytochrome c
LSSIARNSLPLLAAAVATALTGTTVAADGDPTRGARAFQKCYACHSVDPAETNLSGPNLLGLFGRRAGSLDGFEFSAPMIEAGRRGLVWTAATIDVFVTDPQRFVPRNEMGFFGMRDPGERADLVAYLQAATK